MEDLGDLLYIVFAVIGVIYSILKKNKKKATEATPPIFQSDEEDEEFLEEARPVFETISNSEEHEDVARTIFTKEGTAQVISDKAVEEKKKQMNANFTRIKDMGNQKKAEREKEPTKPESDDRLDFNLRQAVIYSEILKRPEY